MSSPNSFEKKTTIFFAENSGHSPYFFAGGFGLALNLRNPRGQGGFVAHRDVLDAFLCRARARLKLGDGMGARADAATACAMAGRETRVLKLNKTLEVYSIRSYIYIYMQNQENFCV